MNKPITVNQFAEDIETIADKVAAKYYPEHEREKAKVMLLNSYGRAMFTDSRENERNMPWTRDDITDRELLELAAKAAGAEVTDFIDCHFPEEMFLFNQTQLKQFIALIDKEMALNPESIVSADEAQLDRIAKMLGEKP